MADYEKTNIPNIILDKNTGTLLNTDMGAYSAIKRAREEMRKQVDIAERVAALELEVHNLKQMIKDHFGRRTELGDDRD